MQAPQTSILNNGYIKIAIFIITAYFFFYGLFHIQGIIVPILFASLLAMLVLPLCQWLEKKGLMRGIAILLCVLLIMIVVAGILTLFSTQTLQFMEDFPLIKEKTLEKYHELQNYIEDVTNITVNKQGDMIKKNSDTFFSSAGSVLSGLLLGLGAGLGNFLLVMIYIFFLLLLRERLRNFILKLFKKEDHAMVAEVIASTKTVTIRYMLGLLIEIVLYGTLSAIGFAALGIKQGIFFGYLGGVLNLVPYLGAIIGAGLPILAALIYKDSLFYPLGVLGVVFIVQFIDNNYITPKIVAGYIRINALATIVVIIIGGALWGISGMVLFLPLLGIIKIICDKIPSLQPFGYLVGEDEKESKAGAGTSLKEWNEKGVNEAKQ